MENTKIAWADHTFNAWIGCAKVSPGCKNCYAEALNLRFGHHSWGTNPRRVLSDTSWKQPARWNKLAAEKGKRSRVFCGSMCDVFENHPVAEQERAKLWPLIKRTDALIWMLLTKRPERIAECLPADWGTNGYQHVWLGTSIESEAYVSRAESLRQIPCELRFISFEPALGPIARALDLTDIAWLIYGGESGAGHRPHDPQWARDVRDLCRAHGVAFFYKQGGDFKPEHNTLLDGQEIREVPVDPCQPPVHTMRRSAH